jgi:hypothetical protein
VQFMLCYIILRASWRTGCRVLMPWVVFSTMFEDPWQSSAPSTSSVATQQQCLPLHTCACCAGGVRWVPACWLLHCCIHAAAAQC